MALMSYLFVKNKKYMTIIFKFYNIELFRTQCPFIIIVLRQPTINCMIPRYVLSYSISAFETVLRLHYLKPACLVR